MSISSCAPSMRLAGPARLSEARTEPEASRIGAATQTTPVSTSSRLKALPSCRPYSAAPVTGFTNFGGLTSRAFLQTWRALGHSPKIGGTDLVEVTPPFDHKGITAYLAASILVDFLTPRVLDGR